MNKESVRLRSKLDTAPGRVLLIDDDEDVLAYVATVLGRRFTVVKHSDPQTAEEAIDAFHPDTIVLDYRMPNRNGFEVARDLRNRSEYDVMSIVILSGIDTDEARLHAYDAGADDFIAKPFEAGELRAKIEVWTRMARRSRTLLQRSHHFKEIALHDALTGLVSRRHVLETLDNEIRRYERYQEPFSLLLVDLDDFKLINDNYGHAAGDQALKAAAEFLRSSLREIDTVSRYGGDEFLVLLPNTTAEDLEAVCEKLSAAEVWARLRTDTREQLSFSIGGCEIAHEHMSATQLIDQADMAMFSAKKSGKGGYFIAPRDASSSDVFREMRSDRETTVDAICRVMGTFFEELFRNSDFLHCQSRLMLELALQLAQRLRIPIRRRQTIRNAARLLPCLQAGLPDEAPLYIALEGDHWQSIYSDQIQRNLALLEQSKMMHKEVALLSAVTEHYDGSGFPNGLQGQDLPTEAQVLAICWQYVMRRSAPLQGAPVNNKETLQSIESLAGSHFAPRVVEEFLALLKESPQLAAASPKGYILIVDDNQEFASTLSRQLAWDGHQVTLATSASEAIEKSGEHDWDAVLLDLHLGDGNGIDVYQRITEHTGHDVPAAILSAQADAESIAQARKSGLRAYLRKPVRIDDLNEVLEMLATHADLEFKVYA